MRMRLKLADSFVPKLLTVILKSSVKTSTHSQRLISFKRSYSLYVAPEYVKMRMIDAYLHVVKVLKV